MVSAMMESLVAVDSNSLSYLVEAMMSGREPAGNLAKQKIALLRIYLYRTEILYMTPSVECEYKRIRESKRREMHDGAAMVLLGDIQISDYRKVKNRTSEYSKYHPGMKNRMDCRILAESELGGCEYLLTYDKEFLSRLKDKTHKIKMTTPIKFWESLNIPRGTKSIRAPHPTNPLSKEIWWRW